MIKLLIVYVHLLATCAALGAIITTDLRLISELARYPGRIAPPERFVMRLISGALFVLCASGGALLWIGLGESPEYLNPKLQAKLLLVGAIVCNAVLLHQRTFPRLERDDVLSPFALGDVCGVAVPVALSNSLWLFCAFLGIARPWNHGVLVSEVLALAAILFAFSFVCALLVLGLASRTRPRQRQDWIDGLKTRIGTWSNALGS
ncbi:MAG: DUF2214 domain-containing protein [Chitinophagaceae bacterium]|nr:DUF2214 domain-containing protein [Rubrivivax sp.]